ncbi:MAG: transglutaminase-like domain-containing protein [Actinomycetota bacterium]
MDPTVRFAQLTRGDAERVSLDEWTALIGAAFDRSGGRDVVGESIADLDRLADECEPDLESILQRLFGPAGLRGNLGDYGDPRNSYLHDVLRRGLGIPISLSVVALEVGRRLGVPIRGVGLPGHFVIECEGAYADPFHGAEVFDVEGIEAIWRRNTGLAQPLDRRLLASVSPRSIVLRMLNNLKNTFVAMDDPVTLRTLATLREAFPELAAERAEHARWLRHWN